MQRRPPVPRRAAPTWKHSAGDGLMYRVGVPLGLRRRVPPRNLGGHRRRPAPPRGGEQGEEEEQDDEEEEQD